MPNPVPDASSPPAPEGVSNARPITIEWGHCDPAGIVFNPRFFEFFDWSTAVLVEAALGLDKAGMMAAYGMAGLPVVDTGARFLSPCRFGDRVDILSTVLDVKRSSFRVRHRLSRGGTLCVEGHETRVWTARDPADSARLRSKPIPDDVVARLLVRS